MWRKEITFDRFIRGLLLLAGLGTAVFILNYLSSVLLPFFVACVFAYMLYPTVKFIQYKLHVRNRTVSIILALLAVIALISLTLFLIVPPAISEIIKFRNLAGDFLAKNHYGAEFWKTVELFLKENIDENIILRLVHENNLMEAMRIMFSQLWTVVYHTVDFLIGVFASFIVLLYMFFILLDYESLSKGWIKLVPKGSRAFAATLATDVERGMNAYFRGQALVALLVGILFCIGFLIIDFPLAIGLGLFIGLLNLVPYLQLIGFIPTILLALLKAANTGENFWFILLSALLVFAIVQTIQDFILVPRIMGKIMGLNPAVILLSLSVWGSLLGMIGLIIALPTTTLILSYYRRFLDKDEKEWEEAQYQIKENK